MPRYFPVSVPCERVISCLINFPFLPHKVNFLFPVPSWVLHSCLLPMIILYVTILIQWAESLPAHLSIQRLTYMISFTNISCFVWGISGPAGYDGCAHSPCKPLPSSNESLMPLDKFADGLFAFLSGFLSNFSSFVQSFLYSTDASTLHSPLYYFILCSCNHANFTDQLPVGISNCSTKINRFILWHVPRMLGCIHKTAILKYIHTQEHGLAHAITWVCHMTYVQNTCTSCDIFSFT